MNPSEVARDETVAGVARQRSDLHGALVELEAAIAAAATSTQWRSGVGRALERLGTSFAAHVATTEGPQGLFETVVQRAPRLDHHCRLLLEEHTAIQSAIAAATAGLDGDTEATRDGATDLLAKLARHRQRGADLVYEAYDVDLGGSD